MEKIVRIVLTQKIANYRKEETIDNKMTYPLPPFSTIIGAIHKACDYTEYHPMDISIQGKYGGLIKKVYQDSCFLNSLQNDRGTLVKMKNPNMLSNAFDIVAQAQKAQGNDFRKGITVQVYNQEILDEYRNLKDKYDEITENKKKYLNPYLDDIKAKKALIKFEKKNQAENKEALQKLKDEENELKQLEKDAKQKFKDYEEKEYILPISKFRTLTRGPKYYELLTDVKLIIHIRTDEETTKDIIDNIYNLKAIGRSEDFVDVEECKVVDGYTMQELDMIEAKNHNSAYLDAKLFCDNNVIPISIGEVKGINKYGTRYSSNKDYIIKDKKRIFNKKSVIYTSEYSIDEEATALDDGIFEQAPSVLIDKIDDEKYYVVNLI